MREALASLMKPELDAARTRGTIEFATAIRRLKIGDTTDNLMKEGFSKDIVESAKELIDELCL